MYFQVARGNCVLEIECGPSAGISCVIYALKKFTGGLGDDDDRGSGDTFTWKKYFIKVRAHIYCRMITIYIEVSESHEDTACKLQIIRALPSKSNRNTPSMPRSSVVNTLMYKIERPQAFELTIFSNLTV